MELELVEEETENYSTGTGKEDLMKRLDAAGVLAKPPTQKKKEKDVMKRVDKLLEDHDNRQYGDDQVFTGSMGGIQKHLDDIVSTQHDIDSAIRIGNSPLLALSQKVGYNALKLVGIHRDIATIEGLFERQVGTIDSMRRSLEIGLDYSGAVLQQIRTYRDDEIVPGLAAAAQRHVEIENELSMFAELYEQIEDELGKTMVTDEDYVTLENTYANVTRKLQEKRSELSEAERTIVFNHKEKGLVSDYERLVTTGTNTIREVNNYVDDVVRHIKKTRPVNRWINENYANMSAVFTTFGTLSTVVITGANEMGAAIGHMAEMSREIGNETYLPSQLGSAISGYKSTILDMEIRGRENFEREAKGIMSGPVLSLADGS